MYPLLRIECNYFPGLAFTGEEGKGLQQVTCLVTEAQKDSPKGGIAGPSEGPRWGACSSEQLLLPRSLRFLLASPA